MLEKVVQTTWKITNNGAEKGAEFHAKPEKRAPEIDAKIDAEKDKFIYIFRRPRSLQEASLLGGEPTKAEHPTKRMQCKGRVQCKDRVQC